MPEGFLEETDTGLEEVPVERTEAAIIQYWALECIRLSDDPGATKDRLVATLQGVATSAAERAEEKNGGADLQGVVQKIVARLEKAATDREAEIGAGVLASPEVVEDIMDEAQANMGMLPEPAMSGAPKASSSKP
jgi:hypothetical protein